MSDTNSSDPNASSAIEMNGIAWGFLMSFVSLVVVVLPLIIFYLFQQNIVDTDSMMPTLTNIFFVFEILLILISYVATFSFLLLTKRNRSAVGFFLGAVLTVLAVPLLLVFACFSMVSNLH